MAAIRPDPSEIDYMGLDEQFGILDDVVTELHCLYGVLKELEASGICLNSIAPEDVQGWIREVEDDQRNIGDKMDRLEAEYFGRQV